MLNTDAKIYEGTNLLRHTASCFAACLLTAASILPHVANAQTTTVGSTDNNGADDEQEQSDLTSVELQCSFPANNPLPLFIQLDPVSNSGGNSSDISILFDTDGDGNANYSYVVTLGNDPFSVIAIDLQEGNNDSSPIKISGTSTNISIGTTTSATSLGINPFDGGDDTRVALNLDLSVIATHAGVTLDDVKFINITTIPSSSATSNPKDILLDTAAAFVSDDSSTTTVDSIVTFDTLTNDSAKIDWSTAQIVTQPLHGIATINPDGTVSYEPDGDYTGADSFTYSAIATDCSTYTATVTVDITGIAAADDAVSVTGLDAGLPAIINVHDNDTIDGAVTSPSNTTLAVASGSSVPSALTFDPSTGAVGVTPGALPGIYSFQYEICDATDPTNCKIATVTVEVSGADLVTKKIVSSGDATPAVGETVEFTISVTNNGSADATNVALTDTLPAGLTATVNNGATGTGTYDAGSGLWAIGSLANGATATLTLEGTVDAGQGGTTITNTLASAATANETDPGTSGDELSASVDAVEIIANTENGTSLAGTASTPIANVRANDTINGDQADATNSTIAESGTWPAGITLDTNSGAISVAAAVSAGTYNIDYELCDLNSPANCISVSDTITVNQPRVDLAITKSNGTTVLMSGSTTTYTVTVTNNGPDPVAGAVVTDAPGTGITCNSASVVNITGDGVPSGSYTFSNLSGAGIVLGTLSIGQTATLTYSCQVN